MTNTIGGVVVSGTSGSVEVQLRTERYTKEANLFHMSMPSGNDTAAYVEDIEGVKGSIRLDGEAVSATTADLKTWEASLRALVDGAQNAYYTYSSDKYGSISVKIDDVSTSWTSDTEQAVIFEMTLIIGGL